MKTNNYEQSELIKAFKAEKYKFERDLQKMSYGKYKYDNFQQIDQMHKTAKCTVSYQGWISKAHLNIGARGQVDFAQQTTLKSIKNEIVMKPPKEKNALPPPNTDQLSKFYKLPPTNQGMQTSTEMFT